MLRTLSLPCAVFLFLALRSANAAPVTLPFPAASLKCRSTKCSTTSLSDAFNGSVSFDTSAADLILADPATGSYTFGAPFGMTVNLDGYTSDASGFLNIGILNSFVDPYTVLATSAAGSNR